MGVFGAFHSKVTLLVAERARGSGQGLLKQNLRGIQRRTVLGQPGLKVAFRWPAVALLGLTFCAKGLECT